MGLDDFTLYVPCTILPSDIIHSPSKFWFNMTPSRHTPAVDSESKYNHPPKNLLRNHLSFPVDIS